jgi:hypothetical protein
VWRELKKTDLMDVCIEEGGGDKSKRDKQTVPIWVLKQSWNTAELGLFKRAYRYFVYVSPTIPPV